MMVVDAELSFAAKMMATDGNRRKVVSLINSVAGGGTLVTFPTLVFLGLPPVTANATNTVAIWPGSLGGMWGYRAEMKEAETRFLPE